MRDRLCSLRTCALGLLLALPACSEDNSGPDLSGLDLLGIPIGADLSTPPPCDAPGVRTEAAPFALPPGFSPRALASLSDGSLSCMNGANDPTYSTIDIDGDGRPDLVLHDSCSDMTVGTTRWLVHKNTGAGFAATATPFALPPGFSARALAGLGDSTLACDNGQNDPSYATLDMDADGRPDLVLLDSCSDMTVGTTRWLVHKNTGEGFAATATPFALPPGFSARAFSDLFDTGLSCDNGQNDPTYSTVDIDGDRRPDLVLHDACTDMTVGTTRWLVHKGGAEGFAAMATPFTLPPGFSTRAFTGLSDTSLSCDNGANDPSYSTVDLDGDGALDLVLHDSCADMAIGTTRWLLHKGSASGFAAMATPFALPPGFSPRALASLSDGSLSCDNGQNDPTYSTVDVDGDRRPDLVLHDSCSDMTVGTTRWLVHKSSGSSFAQTAAPFALPPGFSTRALASLNDASLSCDNGQNDPSYSTLDLDGDRRIDLVFHDSCADMAVGNTRWLLHGGTCR